MRVSTSISSEKDLNSKYSIKSCGVRSMRSHMSSDMTLKWYLVASPAASKTAKYDEDPDQNLGIVSSI